MGALRRFGERLVSSKPGTWLYLNVIPVLDVPLLRLSRGWLSVSLGEPVLLLESVGARSGTPRANPLICVPRGEELLLVASNGGKPRHPAWYHNLRKTPRATVTFRGRKGRYTAREAHGAERDALWREAVAAYSGYAVYEQRAAGREIPLVVLTPESAGALPSEASGGA